MTRIRPIRTLLAAILLLALVAPTFGSDVNKAWLDRISREDRSCVERLLDQSPSPIPGDVTWFGTDPLSWNSLRGRVVIVMSFPNHTNRSLKRLQAAAKAIEGHDAKDVFLLAVHTPIRFDTAEKYYKRIKYEGAVAIDPSGKLCDSLGIYTRPVNLIIGRNGKVRYVGLNNRGIKEATELLVNETFTGAPVYSEPVVAKLDQKKPTNTVAFPPLTNDRLSAKDFRGKTAPSMHVAKWINGKPKAKGKVVIIDFWATWCAPCRASIPHANELAEEFRDDVVMIGISDESRNDFDLGMSKQRLRLKDFKYFIALDSDRKMYNKLGVNGIPHMIVMSSDWIVRWQGHPATLTASTLEHIVVANRAISPSSVRSDDGCNRWANR